MAFNSFSSTLRTRTGSASIAQARACGAQIVQELETHDYGPDHWSDRSYGALDLEGHDDATILAVNQDGSP